VVREAAVVRNSGAPPNLLELKPRRKMAWEVHAESVHLVVPRFGSLLQRWLTPVLRRPAFRVRLDAFGSFVWSRCDGETPVEEIARQLREQYGPDVEPLYDRLERFLRRLEREGFISIT